MIVVDIESNKIISILDNIDRCKGKVILRNYNDEFELNALMSRLVLTYMYSTGELADKLKLEIYNEDDKNVILKHD